MDTLVGQLHLSDTVAYQEMDEPGRQCEKCEVVPVGIKATVTQEYIPEQEVACGKKEDGIQQQYGDFRKDIRLLVADFVGQKSAHEEQEIQGQQQHQTNPVPFRWCCIGQCCDVDDPAEYKTHAVYGFPIFENRKQEQSCIHNRYIPHQHCGLSAPLAKQEWDGISCNLSE